MAKLVVPAGTLDQLSFGEMPVLSQVYNFGNVPLLVNAVLLAVKVPAVIVVAASLLFLQELFSIAPIIKTGKRQYFSVIFFGYYSFKSVRILIETLPTSVLSVPLYIPLILPFLSINNMDSVCKKSEESFFKPGIFSEK